jgi:hypothetical protein
MRMKTTVSLHEFRDAFRSMGRGNQFTYEGLEVIFDYLESMEEDTGEEMELDVIAICCDFTESTPEEIMAEHDLDEDEDILEALSHHTTVLGETDSTIVYVNF